MVRSQTSERRARVTFSQAGSAASTCAQRARGRAGPILWIAADLRDRALRAGAADRRAGQDGNSRMTADTLGQVTRVGAGVEGSLLAFLESINNIRSITQREIRGFSPDRAWPASR